MPVQAPNAQDAARVAIDAPPEEKRLALELVRNEVLILRAEDEVEAVCREDELALERELEGFADQHTDLLPLVQIHAGEDFPRLQRATVGALDLILVLVLQPAGDEGRTGAVDVVAVEHAREGEHLLLVAPEPVEVRGTDTGLRRGTREIGHQTRAKITRLDRIHGSTIVNGTILADYASLGCCETPSTCGARYCHNIRKSLESQDSTLTLAIIITSFLFLFLQWATISPLLHS